ncbi:MAG: cyclopropane fatty acyl phospholipid synthase [Patescibacteria group bacterium]|nr:cyclopropane fatty acyl phospholipid synthase [Patescibacteria group bacterium]
MTSKSKKIVSKLFTEADIKINGSRPWDIQTHNEKLFDRLINQGSMGLGESYMDGWWDTEKLDQFFYKIFSAGLDKKIKYDWNLIFAYLKSKILNTQTKQRARKVAEEHYDLSAELYESFLDPYNQYTCGYFKNTKDLNKAQEQKLRLICEKLQLSPQDKVLDIGCGWGGFAKFASEHYNCHVTGLTISDKQLKYAKKYCRGLPVKIIKSDYRDISGKYDKIVICGMIEHVGYKNYRTIMKVVHRSLKDDGLFLLHTIGGNTSVTTADPWILKYIFPNSMLPSIKQISSATERLFVIEDWHNFSTHYYKTLMAWFDNFDRNWQKLKSQYDERFYRMWKYYLLSFAGSFQARKNQLWQIVFSKKGLPGGYTSIR